MTKISDELINKISDYIEGTCKSLFEVIEHFELDVDDIELEDRLLDVSTECCVVCNWWGESSDMEFDDNLNGGVCSSCHKDEGDDDE